MAIIINYFNMWQWKEDITKLYTGWPQAFYKNSVQIPYFSVFFNPYSSVHKIPYQFRTFRTQIYLFSCKWVVENHSLYIIQSNITNKIKVVQESVHPPPVPGSQPPGGAWYQVKHSFWISYFLLKFITKPASGAQKCSLQGRIKFGRPLNRHMTTAYSFPTKLIQKILIDPDLRFF